MEERGRGREGERGGKKEREKGRQKKKESLVLSSFAVKLLQNEREPVHLHGNGE